MKPRCYPHLLVPIWKAEGDGAGIVEEKGRSHALFTKGLKELRDRESAGQRWEQVCGRTPKEMRVFWGFNFFSFFFPRKYY